MLWQQRQATLANPSFSTFNMKTVSILFFEKKVSFDKGRSGYDDGLTLETGVSFASFQGGNLTLIDVW